MIIIQLVAIVLAAGSITFGARAIDRWPTQIAGRAWRRSETRTLPAGLQDTERLIASSWSAGDAHHRLRPLLGEIAAARLRRHGVALAETDSRARELLGEELWDLVRPDRPRPSHNYEPGLRPTQVTDMVDRLEAL